MSKAFDSLHHPLLLAKLKSYGLDYHSLELMHSYFNQRYNRVNLGNNTTSSWKPVRRECHQGSAFGPLLWNIFQNDLKFLIDSNISCTLMIVNFIKSGIT